MYFFGSFGLMPIDGAAFSASHFSVFSGSYAEGAGVTYFFASFNLMPIECWICSSRYCSEFSGL